ncbi:hypothetical protein N2K95_03765 [Arthrobacter zhaoxinii]|uniref:Uncharacterized protein n=1 Tax=Arthrobacter zhaoxinii TaxID=2964616 RepID=A0ABY5YUQ4_9MICC|nr:hypothetical protein [Arthrobacter zhaoxinii]UWX97813.1 hypothetical protein N2K95_03765 [Arthrobacter zhaoxinii]
MTNMGSSNPVSIDAKRFNVTSKWARARGETVVAVPMDSLPAAVERASARLPKMKLTGVWPERAEFQRSGWNTYARMITVAFEPVTAGSTRVVVTSTPAVATTVLDFGKSRGDVVEALNAVSAEL